jgi:glycerophosphoryl diester phosphodiesterase
VGVTQLFPKVETRPMPSSAPAWLTAQPFAHRGLHDKARGVPENSLAAFRAAVDSGYGIELDVRLSRDGVAMVFHDSTLDRMCGEPGRVDGLDAAELRKKRLLGTNETIPKLTDVCALMASRQPILVEVKNASARLGPIETATAHALRDYRGPFAVMSFNPRTVAWFADHAPQLVRGQVIDLVPRPGPLGKLKMLGTKWLLWRRYGRPQFIAYDINRLPAPLATRARREGMPLLTWTVRTPDSLRRARDLADNIIFEAAGRPS